MNQPNDKPNYIGAVPCGGCGGWYNDGVPHPGNGQKGGSSGSTCPGCGGSGWIVTGPARRNK